MKPGDEVVFKGAVIKRMGHDPRTVAMKGVVLSVKENTVQVDCRGTFDSEDGRSVRWIPVANLAKIAKGSKVFNDGQIIDLN